MRIYPKILLAPGPADSAGEPTPPLTPQAAPGRSKRAEATLAALNEDQQKTITKLKQLLSQFGEAAKDASKHWQSTSDCYLERPYNLAFSREEIETLPKVFCFLAYMRREADHDHKGITKLRDLIDEAYGGYQSTMRCIFEDTLRGVK